MRVIAVRMDRKGRILEMLGSKNQQGVEGTLVTAMELRGGLVLFRFSYCPHLGHHAQVSSSGAASNVMWGYWRASEPPAYGAGEGDSPAELSGYKS